jgi:hypothetical protein
VKDLVESHQFDYWYFPPYTTSLLQPLDLSVMRSFKSMYRLQWDSWLEKRGGDTTEKPSKHKVIEWTSKAWNEVSIETVVNGWKVFDDYKQEMLKARKCKLFIFNLQLNTRPRVGEYRVVR